ncbi:MAG: CoA ester lyase, partial [Mesorhizobium sp.]
LLNIGPIAELARDPASRLGCFVAGTNDLVKDTGILATPDRRYLVPWLMQMVLAARAGGLDLLDGVFNDFRDMDGFARECTEAAAMGFDGKSLIHPAQIEAANRAFAPTPEALAEARTVKE